jgi:glycosyltransferase involved in cell wall biosynthesis
MAKKSMKILLLSVTFFPEENPRANRWKELAFALARQGHEVRVLCRAAPGLPDYLEERGVRIFRVGSRPLGGRLVLERGLQSRYLRFLLRIRAWSWKKLWWPDSSAGWFVPAFYTASRWIRAGLVDRLYTISLPFVAHLVGLALKKRFPGLFWAADHGDPFSIKGLLPQNHYHWFHRLNRCAEVQVLQGADQNYANTHKLADWYREVAGTGIVVQVVPHVLPGNALTMRTPGRGEVLYIDYFGRLIPSSRDIEPFLRILDALFQACPVWKKKLLVRVFGPSGIKTSAFLKSMGSLAHAASLRAMQASDVLLSLGYSDPYMLPMKTMEYLYSTRPILHIAVHPDDPVPILLGDFPTFHCIALYRGTEQAIKELATFLASLPERKLGPAHIESMKDRFGADAVARLYSA